MRKQRNTLVTKYGQTVTVLKRGTRNGAPARVRFKDGEEGYLYYWDLARGASQAGDFYELTLAGVVESDPEPRYVSLACGRMGDGNFRAWSPLDRDLVSWGRR